MKHILLGLLIILILKPSALFSRRDCLQQAKFDALGRSDRPDLDTFNISPSGHFYIHYDLTGDAAPDLSDNNENGIPDYVDAVGMIADSAYHLLVNVMGYQEEPFDGEGGYDIYIKYYGSDSVYGYNYKESGGTSYLEMDNDYGPQSEKSNFNLSPIQIMNISVGHEYFHAIQWGYEDNLGSNAYFYEMSAMWFEDVIIPDGNDYLDGWLDPLFNNPEADFDQTGGGYELALFGHYLSSYLDPKGAETAKNSTIIREMWERYGSTNSDAFSTVQYVLEHSYKTSFIEAWTDFISRNLYNGLYDDMDNPFYYYPDQVLINPIITYNASINDSLSISINIDNASVEILTYEISDLVSILEISHGTEEYIGKFSFVAKNIIDNQLYAAIDTQTHPLNKDDVIHCIYGAKNTIHDLTIEITQYTVPIPPLNLTATAEQDSVVLNWHTSPGPGDSLIYIVFRDNVSLYALTDTHYVDKQGIEELTTYTYYVTCSNDIGESQPSSSITLQSWPSEENVTHNKILAIYPNPIHKGQDSHILYALGGNYSNCTIELINIRGQIVKTVLLQTDQLGWHRESINPLIIPKIAVGNYIIRIRSDNELGGIQKVTILP